MACKRTRAAFDRTAVDDRSSLSTVTRMAFCSERHQTPTVLGETGTGKRRHGFLGENLSQLLQGGPEFRQSMVDILSFVLAKGNVQTDSRDIIVGMARVGLIPSPFFRLHIGVGGDMDHCHCESQVCDEKLRSSFLNLLHCLLRAFSGILHFSNLFFSHAVLRCGPVHPRCALVRNGAFPLTRSPGYSFYPTEAQTDRQTQGAKSRVRLVNGVISIASKPMTGTTIHVRVPQVPGEQRRKQGA